MPPGDFEATWWLSRPILSGQRSFITYNTCISACANGKMWWKVSGQRHFFRATVFRAWSTNCLGFLARSESHQLLCDLFICGLKGTVGKLRLKRGCWRMVVSLTVASCMLLQSLRSAVLEKIQATGVACIYWPPTHRILAYFVKFHPLTQSLQPLSPSRGGQLQRGDGADAIQMARCSGTTGDHAASLGAAQWGNGQCGDERDGEEWVTWRELVMDELDEGVELGGGNELCSFLPKGVVLSRMMQTAVT